MEQVIHHLMTALRSAGVRISPSEGLDALAAVRLVGYGHRQVLKDALGATLAKSHHDKQRFDACFDRFFSPDSLSDTPSASASPPLREHESEVSALSQMLLAGDTIGLSMAMREAAQHADITKMWFFTQKQLYVNRILTAMGVEDLDRDIQRLSQDQRGSQEKAGILQAEKDRLSVQVRDFVEQQYALFAGPATEALMERYLRDMRLSNLEQADFHRMRPIIQNMAKRLNDMYSRRKKKAKRGLLDPRKTLRRNVAYDGVLFEPCWKDRKLDRPDLMVLCDVSRSVQTVARFMLLFLYSLNEAVARIRSFIFCSNLVEASWVFEKYPVDEALVRLQRGMDLELGLGRTDYGQAFRDFRDKALDRVGRKTTLIILGDGRTNYGNPETGILRLMYQRSGRLVWLTPEPPSFWGTADSEMPAYRAHCSMVRECSTVNHLERIVDLLLRTRPH
ncbi:MAG: VWA domain-containing protein [Deltaproteobacteria bacterium]|nr:VWA domain-containing protein [Deltaproteobacteria bacterium]